MVTSGSVTLPTLRAVRRLGASGGVFQSIDVRAELGYAEGSDEAHRMHSVIARLKANGIIQVVGTARKRHQYLRVADEPTLRRQIERALPTKATRSEEPRPLPRQVPTTSLNQGEGDEPTHEQSPSTNPPSAPQRVLMLEDQVAALEERMRADLNSLRAELDDTRARLEQLIALWS